MTKVIVCRSSRHINRLRQVESELKNELDVSSEEESPVAMKQSVGFHLMDDEDSSDEEDESSQVSDASEEEKPLQVRQPIKKQEKKPDDMEFLDQVIEEMAISTPSSASISTRDEDFVLFAIDKHQLNAEKEMRRLFQVESNRKKPQTKRRAFKKKNTLIVSLPDDWNPPPVGLMRLQLVNDCISREDWDIGCDFFEIEYSDSYQDAQSQFERIQATSFDPNNIAMFLRRYPYHVEALMQLSLVYQQHGQMDQATNMIKRSLLVFEYAWTERFSPWTGKSRMDITAGQNRVYFDLMLLHATQIGRRGCSKSAFQLMKFIWAMDPRADPMAIVLRLDYYALCAREYQFLFDWYNAKVPVARDRRQEPRESSITCNELPNLAFSLALAYFWTDQMEKATQALQSALSQYPKVLKLLISKCGFSGSRWEAIQSNTVFANAKQFDGSLVAHLMQLYVERNFSLWKVDQVRVFLENTAETVTVSTPREFEKDCVLNKYWIVQDLSDQIVLLPAEEEVPAAAMEAVPVEGTNRLPADTNPLLLFFQTMLPWNTVETAAQED